MKSSTAAFWILIVLIFICAAVTIMSFIYSNTETTKILEMFFELMKYIITLVGGGYLGIQIGEKQKLMED